MKVAVNRIVDEGCSSVHEDVVSRLNQAEIQDIEGHEDLAKEAFHRI